MLVLCTQVQDPAGQYPRAPTTGGVGGPRFFALTEGPRPAALARHPDPGSGYLSLTPPQPPAAVPSYRNESASRTKNDKYQAGCRNFAGLDFSGEDFSRMVLDRPCQMRGCTFTGAKCRPCIPKPLVSGFGPTMSKVALYHPNRRIVPCKVFHTIPAFPLVRISLICSVSSFPRHT